MEVTGQFQSNLFSSQRQKDILTGGIPDKIVHDIESSSPSKGKSATIKHLASQAWCATVELLSLPPIQK